VPESVHRGVSKKSIAYPGDVIMNIVGAPLVKVAIVPDEYLEWNLNQAITIFRPGPLVTREWLYIYLCSGVFMESEDLVTRGSAGQSNISLTQCRNLTVPLPSIAEQREIAHRVDELLECSRAILAKISSVSDLLNGMNRAALKGVLRTT
jgi:type I restriction enzyme S subunit